MLNKRLILYILMIGVLFHHLIANAQTYPFQRYSTADGLAHPVVTKIFQDSRGFLWFGTRGGVSMYDGSQFKSYLSQGDRRSFILDIWEDDDGTIWFATFGNGIAKLPRGDSAVHWITSAGGILPGDSVRVIFRDHMRNLWIATDNAGIVIMKADGSTRVLTAKDGIPRREIWAITEGNDETIWIGGTGELVRCQWQSDGGLRIEKVLDLWTLSLIVLRNGDILAGTRHEKRGGIFRYRSGRLDTIIASSKAKHGVKGTSLCEDSQGNVWVGTSYGLYFLESNRLTRLRIKHGLHNEYINDILQDREGTMWFATDDGVEKLRSPRFVNYSVNHGLSGSMVISMLQDIRKNLWLGTYNGLNQLDPTGRITIFGEGDGLRHRVIHALVEDNKGDIWIGNRGVSLYSHGKLVKADIEGVDPTDYVSSLFKDNAGNIWIGANGKIIKVRNGRTQVVLDEKTGIPSDRIEALLVDKNGTVWFGTPQQGAGYYRSGVVKQLTTENGLPHISVNWIFQDSRERVWIATDGGIAVWNEKRLEWFAAQDQTLQYGRVGCVFEDTEGVVWLTTDYGVHAWKDSILHHFAGPDGLLADKVFRGLVDDEGNLWFGTVSGVSRLDKKKISGVRKPPGVYFRSTTAGDDERPFSMGSQLTYDRRTVAFSFNALSFIDEKNMLFQWMLEGFDREWMPAQKQRSVRYTNLDPGNYVFSVRAANRNGPWSEPAQFAFTILPPYWQRWWFLLGVVIAVSGLAFLTFWIIHHSRIAKILVMERIRTRIASDLHDEVGSTLTKISLQSELLQAGTDGGSLNESLKKIGSMSRELVTTMSDIVWSIDARNDKLGDLIDRMMDFALSVLSPKQIECHFDCKGLELQKKLPVEIRQNIYLIFKEAINNIAKYAEASTVDIQLSNADGVFTMLIADNGKGLIQQTKLTGHGIKNMKMRARLINAEIEMLSKEGLKIILTREAL
ncbi:MAG: hypothetical protein HY707_08870 [Ignavibacteriae bacterium]|nr:hypothetical protein [Ignavibacteriota bacterium]